MTECSETECKPGCGSSEDHGADRFIECIVRRAIQSRSRRASRDVIAKRKLCRAWRRAHSTARTTQSHAAGLNGMKSPLPLSRVKQCS